jgi:hypothetical protein
MPRKILTRFYNNALEDSIKIFAPRNPELLLSPESLAMALAKISA